MKILILTVFSVLLFFAGAFSQEKQIQGVVVDSKTSHPLPFVNISKSVGQQGTASDELGKFSITVDINDSLFFSAVGYKRKYFAVSQIKNIKGVIKLDEDIQLLSELSVTSNRKVNYESHVIGYHKSKIRSSLTMRTSGSQIAVFLENKFRKEGVFETLYLRLRSTGSFKFQIRVFEKNSNGLPGRDLLRENLILESKRINGIFSINLASKNIIFPSTGAFICLQTMESQDRKTTDDGSKPLIENSTFLSKDDDESSTYNGFRDRYWVKNRPLNSNVMFGAKIRFYELD